MHESTKNIKSNAQDRRIVQTVLKIGKHRIRKGKLTLCKTEVNSFKKMGSWRAWILKYLEEKLDECSWNKDKQKGKQEEE